MTSKNELLIKKSIERWHPMKQHAVQSSFLNDNVRIKILVAGRRSGKSECIKRIVIESALKVVGQYAICAPTRDQVKKIYWKDLKIMCFVEGLGLRVSETELIVYLPNGSTIHLIGLDKPQRIEGVFWMAMAIDEYDDVKPSAWEENILPALDTFNPLMPNYRPWCIVGGVPNSGQGPLFEISKYAKNANDDGFKFYTWFSSEVLSEKVISEARARMSPRIFRQEYEASFESVIGRIYEDYGRENYTSEVIQPYEQLLWCHDFNYSPLSSAICVQREDKFMVLDEIILNSANAIMTGTEFCEKYKNHENKHVVLYGDPSGKAGEKHGLSSNYIEIEKILKGSSWKVTRKVKGKAPAIRDRQNAVRSLILSANGQRRLLVNPKYAKYADKGLETVQLKQGSTFLEEETEYQHITTAIGYCIDYEYPIRREYEEVKVDFVPRQSFYS